MLKLPTGLLVSFELDITEDTRENSGSAGGYY
jgi:hypothetical protein